MLRKIAVGLLLLLVGCGGGSGGKKAEQTPADTDPRADPLELRLSAAMDSFSFAFVPPETNVTLPLCPRCTTTVGDLDADTNGVGVQSFLFFTLAALPAGATIESATLRLYESALTGTPFSSLGAVLVWRVQPYGDPCASAAPIGGAKLAPGSAVQTAASNPQAWHEGNVTALARAAWAEGTLDLRLMLAFSTAETDSDSDNDVVNYVGPCDSDLEKRPVLVVEYYPPDE